jgi:hypothetical protein
VLVADEHGSGDTTYTWQLRAFAAAIAAVNEGSPADKALPTSAAHAVATMRVIDDAYGAAGLALRP